MTVNGLNNGNACLKKVSDRHMYLVLVFLGKISFPHFETRYCLNLLTLSKSACYTRSL
ncbi:hypothetical protein HMPREF9370_0229 [Neisseria wadsworthii 9715]|uniref:Uncharacterized protein n=1 Tax=Neisseria wadsworthii 9715 TaxID=1030841 RepID=G4CMC0_9NEIS|nr:hypothetical protein HMPREF9370_0229 [Neisseria wadsworthii 9715]